MKRYQIKGIIITKNSLFLAGLIAGGILLGCAAQKQVIHDSSGIIDVTIRGLKKEELQLCEVKAIASGKEYLPETRLMKTRVIKDASTGGLQLDPIHLPEGLFTIKGVPVGPAEVRVDLKKENLPAQKVYVEGGTKIGVNFEFESNKVILSGIVTQLGKPASKWLVTFRPPDEKPTHTTAGVQTASDGSYNYKLNPGTYEIQVWIPGVFEKDGMKLKTFEPKFMTTYTVTKAETLNLEVSTLKKIEAKKSTEAAQAQQAQGPFAIKDKRLLQLSGPDPCHTDTEIITSSSQGYQIKGLVHSFGGQSHLWCNEAKHTWIGRHENIQQGAIAVIDSDKENPLQFKIDKEKGYVYQKGKGTVTMPDGRLIKLPMSVEVIPYRQEESLDRSVSEKFVAQIVSSWIRESLKVSPDSKRVACVAKVGNKLSVVVDGKMGKQYDGIGVGTLIFSADSKRVAYGARLADKWFVVVDGKEEKQYDALAGGTLIFSPDSRRVAYMAKEGTKWCVVVDGKEEKQYDTIGKTLIFSPDGKRLAYQARLANKWFVVVDGKEGKQYDGLFTIEGGKIIFDTTSSFHYLTQKDENICLVEESIK